MLFKKFPVQTLRILTCLQVCTHWVTMDGPPSSLGLSYYSFIAKPCHFSGSGSLGYAR